MTLDGEGLQVEPGIGGILLASQVLIFVGDNFFGSTTGISVSGVSDHFKVGLVTVSSRCDDVRSCSGEIVETASATGLFLYESP